MILTLGPGKLLLCANGLDVNRLKTLVSVCRLCLFLSSFIRCWLLVLLQKLFSAKLLQREESGCKPVVHRSLATNVITWKPRRVHGQHWCLKRLEQTSKRSKTRQTTTEVQTSGNTFLNNNSGSYVNIFWQPQLITKKRVFHLTNSRIQKGVFNQKKSFPAISPIRKIACESLQWKKNNFQFILLKSNA